MRYVCQICGYIYDPEKGDSSQGVPPGTPFEELPETWVCPVCGAERDLFEPEMAREHAGVRPTGGRVVIVGNGVAGFTVAHELVKKGGSFEVELVAAEPYHYYARPQLPRLVSGELDVDDLIFYDEAWYAKHGIRVRLGDPVVALDREARKVQLRSGEVLTYDWLVLACGSRPAVPPIEGIEKGGVFTLRTIEDALTIRRAAEKARRAVIVGGGLLGLEAGKGLLSLGLEVTVVELAPHLLPRQLDAEGAAILQGALEAQGFRFVLGTSVEAFLGDDVVRHVRLRDDRDLPAELVLVSVGIRPEVELARGAGLRCEKGVLVDDSLRTDDEHIFACGDVAEHRGRVYGIIPPSIDQAKVVAANLMGENVLYHGSVPSASLKVAGVDLTSVGEVHADGPDVEHIRVSLPGEGRYRKIVLRDGRAIGAVAICFREQVPRILRVVAEQADLSHLRQELAAPEFDFGAWA